MYAINLDLGWGCCSLLVTALIYPTFAALLPTATRDVTIYSPTLEAAVPNVSPNCVSPTEEPDWAGPIDATDCTAALFTLTNQVSIYGDQYFTFWSKKIRPSVEPSMGWELPYGKTAGEFITPNVSISYSPVQLTTLALPGTCVVLFRIAKDFGDTVIPLPYAGPHNYLKTSTRQPTARERWEILLVLLSSLLNCVQTNGEPGWTTSPSANGILMLLSTESAMARQWWYSATGLGVLNSTTLGLVEVS